MMMHPTSNLDANGILLHGDHVMEYHSMMAAKMGSPQFTSLYEGDIYRFSSAANRDMFKQFPARYAAAYGGFCAMGVALGKKLDVDPMAFRTVEGKLYLNLNSSVQRDWVKAVPGNIMKAERNWPKVRELPDPCTPARSLLPWCQDAVGSRAPRPT